MIKKGRSIYFLYFLVMVVIFVSGCTDSNNGTDTNDTNNITAQEVTYQDIIDNPDNYMNKNIKFTGRVLVDKDVDYTIYLGDPNSNDTSKGIITVDIPDELENLHDTLKIGDIITVTGKLTDVSDINLDISGEDDGRTFNFSYTGLGYNINATNIEVN
ncbi:MAG: hypothetical protein QME14_04050 [Methanobacteriaceae archaeon]|nr:hypothetical protein [Methanobacteriaceae archaeon]